MTRQEVGRYARQVAPAAAILASAGVLVAAWAAAGVTALLIATGLDLIAPRLVVVGAALACAAMAFATGTSWGAVATVGVALMGMARGLGVDPALAAGAVVAGAHFGDKLSPLSETATLAAAVAGTDLYTHLRHTAWTTVPGFAAGLALYLALGAAAPPVPDAPPGTPSPAAADLATVTAAGGLRHGLAAAFDLTPWLWLPLALVVAAAVLRWPVVPSLLASAAVALVLAVTVQGLSPAAVPALLWQGYRSATGDPLLDRVLTQGGLLAMARIAGAALGLFVAVIAAVRSRPGQALLARVGRLARTPARTVAGAVLTALLLMGVSGASYLAILVTGELFRPHFRRQRLAAENLSRTLEDSGTMVAPLIPWGVSGLYMAAALGVSAWQYGPYALMNYAGFLLALLYGSTGWAIRPLPASAGSGCGKLGE